MRFCAATGSPYSDKDAAVIGRVLVAIAERHKVRGIRQLSAKVVLKEVMADKGHPLWRFYTKDLKQAAHERWLEQTRKLIRSVRIIREEIKPVRPRPVFYSADNVPQIDISKRIRLGCASVFSPDLVKSESISIRAAEMIVLRIEASIKELDRYLEQTPCP